MYKKGNNHGKGYNYEFKDGYHGWTYGFGKNELKHEIMKHGKLVKYIPC